MNDPTTQIIEPAVEDPVDDPDTEAVAEDVLVEEISIDGMCGVY